MTDRRSQLIEHPEAQAKTVSFSRDWQMATQVTSAIEEQKKAPQPSLARGLASRTAESLNGKGLRYTEVEPHSLASAAHEQTQKAVTELLGVTIAELAMQGPTFVLLDEVETILADRAKLSLQANPIDVHRATDTALVQLDRLAAEYNNLLLVATSNFPEAIDSAFLSRTDMILNMPLPDVNACRQILLDTVRAMVVTSLANTPRQLQVALKLVF